MEDKLRVILTRFSEIIASRKGGERHVQNGIISHGRANFMEAHMQVDENGRRRAIMRSTPSDKKWSLNGVIVDESRILVFPPKQLRRIEYNNINEVHNFTLKNYRITEAANGTMVTLYCWDNQWCLSTTRGIYVNDNAIVGSQSLMKIFVDLLEARGLSLHNFDRDISYTFVLCHPDYHVLPVELIYFIRAFSVVSQSVIETPDFLRPFLQPKVEFGDGGDIAKVNYFKRFCIGATQRLMRGDMNQVAGFILRSISPNGHDYYIESDITHFLQRFVYQSFRSSLVESRFRRMHFILHVYLNSSYNSDLYHTIRDRYESDFKVIDDAFKTIATLYEKYLSTGVAPSIIAFDKLFSALRKDSVPVADMHRGEYFDQYFELFTHIRNVT